MKKLILKACKSSLSTDKITNSMTIGELKSLLEHYDEDEKIYLSFDSGFYYGVITERNFEEEED